MAKRVYLLTLCSDAERSLFDSDVGAAHAFVSSSGHVTADVTVDNCTPACDTNTMYFPFDRWECSVDLVGARHIRLTASRSPYLTRWVTVIGCMVLSWYS